LRFQPENCRRHRRTRVGHEQLKEVLAITVVQADNGGLGQMSHARFRWRSIAIMQYGFGFTVAVATAALAVSAHAQWSNDAAVNLPLADNAGEQTQDKIVPTADGGFYVSCFDNETGGYDVRLQRLNAQGVEQWAHNGILIADRSFSSTTDYDLDIDTAGNALITFRDDRFGGTQITANRVDPSGTLLWGANGVQLTNTTDFVANPKIVGTTDGNIVVAWVQNSATNLMKLDASGSPLWTLVSLTTGGSSFSPSDMDASDNGGVVLSLVRGFLGATYWATKLDTNGAQLWNEGAPLQIFSGALQNGNFPQIVPDGSGGAVFGWYGTGPLECYAQHILSNGTAAFPANGVAASTNATQIRVSPSVAYHADTDETFLFYSELNSLQSMSGVSAQKFDALGNRMWGATGKVIERLSANSRDFVNCVSFGDGAIAAWRDSAGFNADQLRATRLDNAGNSVWGPAVTTLCSVTSGKGRVVAQRSANDFIVVGFADNRADANNIYLQHVLGDGTLDSPVLCVADMVTSATFQPPGDGQIDGADLAYLLGDWGANPGSLADIVTSATFQPPPDGIVDAADLAVLLGAWGACE
jgi:hypothetical protein